MEPFPLMKLPREVRDKIYRELLAVEMTRTKFRGYRVRPGSGLTTAILCANRLVHEELSIVLHDRNAWICLTIQNLRLSEWPETTILTYLSQAQLRMLNGKFVIRIELLNNESSKIDDSLNILFSIYELRHLQTIMLQQEDRRSLNLRIKFESPLRRNATVQTALLDCLTDLREVGHATIQGYICDTVASQQATLMTTPFRNFESFFDRARVYQQRADDEATVGHFYEAADLYIRSFEYPYNIRDYPLWVTALDGFSADSLKMYIVLGNESYLRHALCKMKNSEASFAYRLLFMHKSLLYPNSQRIKRDYYMGLASVAKSEELEAADSFMKTLEAEPGHKGAERELDAMEMRLETMPATKRKLVASFLRNVCSPFRHRGEYSANDPYDESAEFSKVHWQIRI